MSEEKKKHEDKRTEQFETIEAYKKKLQVLGVRTCPHAAFRLSTEQVQGRKNGKIDSDKVRRKSWTKYLTVKIWGTNRTKSSKKKR